MSQLWTLLVATGLPLALLAWVKSKRGALAILAVGLLERRLGLEVDEAALEEAAVLLLKDSPLYFGVSEAGLRAYVRRVFQTRRALETKAAQRTPLPPRNPTHV